VAIRPDRTFADCPDPVDVLFVPGGAAGTIAAMQDRETLDFVASRGKTARYVTSVCSGSLVLAAAGLLRGYKATSHWSVREVLPDFGAKPGEGRVVVDRNRITAGGVTAGIDFGLRLAEVLRGREMAQALELMLEYDPQPPFRSGTPATAPPEVTARLRQMYSRLVAQAKGVAASTGGGASR
jgi:cyclohexyl-isocyanide hydratase